MCTEEILNSIEAGSKVFCVMDCVKGYFQVELDEESSRLTTMLLPWGRYRHKREPMGLSCSSDELCARSDKALEGIGGCLKLVDDILVFAPDIEMLQVRIKRVLQRCRDHGIMISQKKLRYGTSVEFAGHLVSAEGVAPHPKRLEVIAQFPVPRNIKDMRSFLGSANQLGRFTPDLAQVGSELRTLLQKEVNWNWLPQHQAVFEKTKAILTSAPVVQIFNKGLKTELLTDASRLHGMGFALIQRDQDNQPRLICCGSRSFTATESMYATIELEMWAAQ